MATEENEALGLPVALIECRNPAAIQRLWISAGMRFTVILMSLLPFPYFFPVYSLNKSGYFFFKASIFGRSHTKMYGFPGLFRA